MLRECTLLLLEKRPGLRKRWLRQGVSRRRWWPRRRFGASREFAECQFGNAAVGVGEVQARLRPRRPGC